jgi:hypothetical protein
MLKNIGGNGPVKPPETPKATGKKQPKKTK